MKTREFLAAVLPSTGIYFATQRRADGVIMHRSHTDVNQLALDVVSTSDSGQDVWFALAQFEQPSYIGDDGKRHWRGKENALSVKALWVDIDVGEGKLEKGTGYPSQRDALAALLKFRRDTELPAPTFIVSSGNGLHVYWVLTQEVSVNSWSLVAGGLKTAAKQHGFFCDPSRTADVSSVLRPIGTMNWKDQDNPLPVEVLKQTQPCSVTEIASKLAAAAASVITPTTSQTRRTGRVKSALTSNNYLPSCADRVADRCATIGKMRDTKGAEQDEPLWRACLGVLAYTVQGDDVCHEWSGGHAEYDETDCQNKIDARRTAAGPTLCDTMRQHSTDCEGCKNTCKTPIQLGVGEPEHLTEIKDEVLPDLPERLKRRFAFNPAAGGLGHTVHADDPSKTKTVTICSQFVKPEYIFRDDEGEHWVHISTRVRPYEWESSDIKVGALAQGGRDLARALGSRAGITVKNPDGMAIYMQTWFDTLRQNEQLETMRRCMGWQEDDSFILGDRRFLPDGTDMHCTVSRDLDTYTEGHKPIGDLDENIRLIDQLYNRPHHEVYQFVLGASLGSALMALIHRMPVGIPISLWSKFSGGGKSTVCQFAMGLWGNPAANGQMTNADNATEYSMFIMSGMRRNVPVLIDETSNWDAKRISSFAYTYSSGAGKLQGKADGGLRDNSNKNWTNFLFLTSNRSLISTMSASVGNCGPQIARIFEVPMPDIRLSASDRPIIQALGKHSGLIGREFVRYVVSNREKVTNMIEAVIAYLHKHVDDSTDARYWVMTAACTMVALRIAKNLGLFKFDISNLNNWITLQVRRLRGSVMDATEDADEILARMINSFSGSILVTNILGGHKEVALRDPNYPLRGNVVAGRMVTNTQELYLAHSSVAEWCSNNNVDATSLHADLVRRGRVISPKKIRITIGKGVRSQPGAGSSWCWHLSTKDLSLASTGSEEVETCDTETDSTTSKPATV